MITGLDGAPGEGVVPEIPRQGLGANMSPHGFPAFPRRAPKGNPEPEAGTIRG